MCCTFARNWSPKSGDQRAIPMTARVQGLLRSKPHQHRWVFTANASKKYPKGDHQVSERRLLRSLKRRLKRLGLPGHLHTFRHAFASHLVSMGVPEAVIRSILGHIDEDILKLYTHIADQRCQDAVKELDGDRKVRRSKVEADKAGDNPNSPADSQDEEKKDETDEESPAS
ncbi:MAG: tyrosine-type recombinase/integrase [Planctomycetota bacterium]|nr:tyrosine-type recombinase/integrase [Planctomycetota bacterium]